MDIHEQCIPQCHSLQFYESFSVLFPFLKMSFDRQFYCESYIYRRSHIEFEKNSIISSNCIVYRHEWETRSNTSWNVVFWSSFERDGTEPLRVPHSAIAIPSKVLWALQRFQCMDWSPSVKRTRRMIITSSNAMIWPISTIRLCTTSTYLKRQRTIRKLSTFRFCSFPPLQDINLCMFRSERSSLECHFKRHFNIFLHSLPQRRPSTTLLPLIIKSIGYGFQSSTSTQPLYENYYSNLLLLLSGTPESNKISFLLLLIYGFPWLSVAFHDRDHLVDRSSISVHYYEQFWPLFRPLFGVVWLW